MKIVIVIIVLIVLVNLIFGFLMPTDSTDKSRWKRSGLSVYKDYETGIEYVKGGMFGGTTPRLDKDGNIKISK